MKFDDLLKTIEEQEIDDVSMEITGGEENIDDMPTPSEVEDMELSGVDREEVKALVDALDSTKLAAAADALNALLGDVEEIEDLENLEDGELEDEVVGLGTDLEDSLEEE